MERQAWWLALALVACSGETSQEQTSPDAATQGETASDGGVPNEDAGRGDGSDGRDGGAEPAGDGGAPPAMDGGSTGDGGATLDSGLDPADAGSTAMDGGASSDAGSGATDAGSGATDAEAGGSDAGPGGFGNPAVRVVACGAEPACGQNCCLTPVDAPGGQTDFVTTCEAVFCEFTPHRCDGPEDCIDAPFCCLNGSGAGRCGSSCAVDESTACHSDADCTSQFGANSFCGGLGVTGAGACLTRT